jgi:ABC-2 type transport system ATP-binding protein
MTEGNANYNIIHTRNLTKKFADTTVVNELNLEVPTGVIFGFVGPSGCGKTTSVRLLLGIYEPDSGEASVLAHSPQKFGRRERARIGYMPQQFVMYPELTVWENLNFAASLYGVPLKRRERLEELLDLVELTGHEKKTVRELSGGMKRRLSLAAAIIHNPELIFLDEPTAGVDPVLRQKFWEYFQQLKGEGRTLFITTQYVSEASYCDYVGLMVDGRLLMVDTPDGLRRRALGGDVIHLHTTSILNQEQFNALKAQDFVLASKVSRLRNNGVEIVVEDASLTLRLLLEWCQMEQIGVESASEHLPVFDDVFVKLIKQEAAAAEAVND